MSRSRGPKGGRHELRAGGSCRPSRTRTTSRLEKGKKKQKKLQPSNAESFHISVGLTKLYLQVRKCRPGL